MTIKELNTLCAEIKKTPNFPFPIEEWHIVTQQRFIDLDKWCTVVFLNRPQRDILRVVYCNMLKGGVLVQDTLTVAEYTISGGRELGRVENEIVKDTGISMVDLIYTIELL